MTALAGFCGGSYRAQSPNFDAEKCINLFVESGTNSTKAPSSLLCTPGFTLSATAAQGPVRGMFSQDGRAWAAIGFTLWEIASDGTLTNRGTLVSDNNPATFCSSGDAGHQLFITSGGTGYIFDLLTNVLTSVLSGATMGAYLDGYFLALTAATSTLHVSDLLNGLVWDPTQVAQRLQGSDRWIAMVVNHAEIWLYGSETTEVWYNAGTAPFPFAPFPNGFLKQGLGAAFAVGNIGTSLAWLSRNSQGTAMVVRSNGFTAERISTHAVEFAIHGYADVSDAIAWSYQDQGHEFYVLTFPSANATWCFDSATGLWHERGFWNSPMNRFDAYRPQYHCYAFSHHLVGDRLTGSIYVMSTSTYLEVDGNGIRRLRAAPVISNENQWLFFPMFELDLETGMGLQTGQGSDPTVMMRYSDDGAHTWSNERTTSAGKVGQYRTRVRFARCGRSRHRVFEVSMTDPVPWRIFGAFLPGLTPGSQGM